jgi:hypothetical protein
MTILFLDFDGVLHPDPCRDPARLFEHAPRLAAALAPFTQLAVVLSTAWRTHHPVDELAAHLPPTLRAKVVGATRCFHAIERRPALVPYRRQAECQHWIDSERPGAAWLALDDRAAEFEPYCDRLIVTRSATGLDEAALNRLRFALTQAARDKSVASAEPGCHRSRKSPARVDSAAVGRSDRAPAARHPARQRSYLRRIAKTRAGPRPTRGEDH